MQTITAVDQFKQPTGDGATKQDWVSLLLRQALMADAIQMARVGRFREAESLIEGMPDSPSALDLKARIRCQQGRLYDAERLWRQALAQDPDNEDFRAGLQQLATMQKRSTPWASIRTLSIGLVVIAVFVIAAVVVTRRLDQLRNSILALANKSAPASTIISSGATSAPPASTGTTTPANKLVDLTGVVTHAGEQEQTLTFENGLFFRGSRLKPEARRLLTEVAHQLRKQNGNLRVQVIGHTDNSLPRHARLSDNVSLGMSRALAVFNYFRQQNLFPAEAISVSSSGDTDPPFANTTHENRLKNQTVSLRIVNR